MAELPESLKGRYHFIGIGGIGMSGIARLLLHRGAQVSGSDLKNTPITDELRDAGARIFIGHNAENVRGAAVAVYSSAIGSDNPEIAQAKISGVPLIKRAEALSLLMKDKSVITVSGSHGKTTTTSLVSFLLLEAGLDPTVAVGGILKNIGANVRFGRGGFFVAEADESDGSFLYYRPDYSIITNIDREHLDYYGTFELELEAFGEFMDKTPAQGCLICCGDDPNLRLLLASRKQKHIFFGLKKDNDIYAGQICFQGLSSEFDCFYRGKLIGRFELALGGEHNISNALSVVALGLELGIDIAFIKNALSGYKGAGRRLEVKYQGVGLMVIDDYAHHPSEIRATLEAAKKLAHKRMIVIFQPHRYTRTKLLLDDFAGAFDAADCLVITDIYPAGELPLEGVSAKGIFDKIRERSGQKEVSYLAIDKIRPHILAMLEPGDLVMTLGAGDITKVGDELAQELKRKSPGARAA
ncbi:MAG: UDP-N-acetylmuramate--L-alanine ligase [Candidatus Omnitrophota bacterium]|nr:UDP-N-acetylmuramate--L-alanine ligase [Candidatus Omnitrophota bacterium]